MKTVGIVAARYDSSRLPGKALKDICGRPMIWWAYQSVSKADILTELYVATDDNRIVEFCRNYNIPVLMTKNTHLEAANRLQEVSEKISADFYVQINGDEPLLDPKYIAAVIPDNVPQEIEFGTNLIAKMKNPTEVIDPSNIKVEFNEDFIAVCFSRAPIPFPYKSIKFDYYKHIGVIGYNKRMLDFYATHTPGRFERIEGIATQRFTDYGKKLLCIEVEDNGSLSVDTNKDLAFVRGVIKDKLAAGELSDFEEIMRYEDATFGLHFEGSAG